MNHPLIEQTLTTQEVFEGAFFRITRDEVQLPNGAKAVREYIKHPGAVAIVALTDSGKVVMERQYRHAAQRVFLEVPAGKIDRGEAPLACGQRELLEETGYTAQQWHHLGEIHPCIGYADEHIQVFLARGLMLTERKLDHGEFLEVLEMPLEGVLALILRGEITDAKTIACLFMAERAIRQGF